MNAEQKLRYGVIEGNLVFGLEQEVIDNARKWHAIKNAETWGDFVDFTSEETFHALIQEILEILGYEALYPNYLMGEDLSTYITDLHLPQLEDPFTTDLLPGFDDGSYVPVLAQETISWMPPELQENLGQIDLHPIHEFIYRIDPEAEELVVQTLEAAGYRCKCDQALMEQAHGLG